MLKFNSYFALYKQILSRKLILNTTVGAAIFFMCVGVIYWATFNAALEITNTLEFCISCHEMKDTVYVEYQQTIHYKNRSGVRTTCPDCHVPSEWQHKVVRKIRAVNELFHKATGAIDTLEKFHAKRAELAQIVWQNLHQTDSRECRNCHSFKAMAISAQTGKSGWVHKYASQRNKTCIDCHKGIAHHLPEKTVIYKGGSDDDHEFYEEKQLQCYQCHQDMPNPSSENWND